MNIEEYRSKKISTIQELARLEKLGWGNEKTESKIFPYVIIEAINLLMNSEPIDIIKDYTETGKSAAELVDYIFATIPCGYGCCWEVPYGFVPEAGCKIHDI